MRLGEIIALEWCDIDLAARRLAVERSDWQGYVTVPKGGRSRQLPMTRRLTAALKAARRPAATEDAIRLLDGRQSGLEPLANQSGEILDTGERVGTAMRSAFALPR